MIVRTLITGFIQCLLESRPNDLEIGNKSLQTGYVFVRYCNRLTKEYQQILLVLLDEESKIGFIKHS